MKLTLFLILFISFPALAFELVAHRGVHQTFHRADLQNETCTATRIDTTGHDYLENTISSIEKAFHYGADVVELDIHPIPEDSNQNTLIVFHDWTLSCRTNANCKNGCITHKQTLAYLKSLDIGYGYTFDNGNSYPFREKYIGAMPTLKEVLNILRKYPNKKILVNQKDNFEKTVQKFIDIISYYPESIRTRVMFPRLDYKYAQKLKELNVPDSIFQSKKAEDCFKDYIFTGWYTYPDSCKNLKFFVPIRETLGRLHPWLKGLKATDVLWGWPTDFIKKVHANGSQVYASQVDSLEELEMYKDVGLDGIMTNKIEIIGPELSK